MNSVFTWLPLSASAKALHPSSITSTSVSGPTHLRVGPVSTVEVYSLGKKQLWWLVWVFWSLGAGILFSWPAICDFKWSICQAQKASQYRHSLTKCPESPTHETLTFLPLVKIHGLCHPEGQSLYVVWFGWGTFHWIRVWSKQVWLDSSHVSHRGGILLVTLMGIIGHAAWVMSCFEFLGQMLEGIKASVCLLPLWQICHGKAQHIPQAGGWVHSRNNLFSGLPPHLALGQGMRISPLLQLHELLACSPLQFHVLSDGFHTTTESCCHNHAHFWKNGPCALVDRSKRCS